MSSLTSTGLGVPGSRNASNSPTTFDTRASEPDDNLSLGCASEPGALDTDGITAKMAGKASNSEIP